MRKSAIATLVLTILFLIGGIGLVVYTMTAGPEVVSYNDGFSFFSWSYTYSSYDTARLDSLFDLGRMLITCGIIMLGFTLVLTDVGCSDGRKKKQKKAKEAKYQNVDAQYQSVNGASPRAERKSESERMAAEAEASPANEEDKPRIPDPEEIIHL